MHLVNGNLSALWFEHNRRRKKNVHSQFFNRIPHSNISNYLRDFRNNIVHVCHLQQIVCLMLVLNGNMHAGIEISNRIENVPLHLLYIKCFCLSRLFPFWCIFVVNGMSQVVDCLFFFSVQETVHFKWVKWSHGKPNKIILHHLNHVRTVFSLNSVLKALSSSI